MRWRACDNTKKIKLWYCCDFHFNFFCVILSFLRTACSQCHFYIVTRAYQFMHFLPLRNFQFQFTFFTTGSTGSSALTWFCTVIVSRCRCSSTMFVSSNMAAIFFESGTRTLFSLLLGLLISPSSRPSLFSSSFSCLEVLGADEIAESSALDVIRSFCGFSGMGWKVELGRLRTIGDMIVSRDLNVSELRKRIWVIKKIWLKKIKVSKYLTFNHVKL